MKKKCIISNLSFQLGKDYCLFVRFTYILFCFVLFCVFICLICKSSSQGCAIITRIAQFGTIL